MKYCPNCGTALEDAALFCTACGVQQAPAAPVAPAPVAAPVYAAPAEAPVYAAPEVPVYTAPEPEPTTAYVGSPEVPAYEPAPNYAPAYAPVYPANYAPAPTASVGAKVLGGIGFGLSLFGFLWALFAFIFGCAAMEEAEAGIAAFIYALMLSPFSILGTVFCGNSRKNGNRNGLTACGKVFGIIGIVLFGLGLLMGITGMSM